MNMNKDYDSVNLFENRPVTMNSHNNLLEIEEHMYILDDVKKPNVFRNMFPYSEVPKIPFNDRRSEEHTSELQSR